MIAPAELIERWGGCFATELGIDLASPEGNERFRWFVAAVLYGARISTTIAARTWRTLDARGVLTPWQLRATGWDGLVRLLDAGGYVRYDYKTASKLLTLSTHLIDHYDGSLDVLHDAARDADDLSKKLKSLAPGIGDTTVGIFLRELRGIWAKADPPLAPLAMRAAQSLGYIAAGQDPDAARRRLEAIWRKAPCSGRRFADFESALVRQGLYERHAAQRRTPHAPRNR
jgi:hypothetical protein